VKGTSLRSKVVASDSRRAKMCFTGENLADERGGGGIRAALSGHTLGVFLYLGEGVKGGMS